jgi:putative copper export protein/methionine-rich copper-binding protein CopC
VTSRRGRTLARAAARTTSAAGLALALLAVAPFVVGPWLGRPAGFVVEAHSELVASSPGAGTVVATSPDELRLVFSEPFDAGYTSLDVLDGSGTAVLSNVGTQDPTDARVLVAVLPSGAIAGPGLFTVRWRTLSASDGHVARGFYTIGVGDVTAAAVGAAEAGGSGDLHSGHSAGIVAVEIPGKILGYGGSMLAVGLAILGFLVLRPAARGESGAATGGVPAGATGGVPGGDPGVPGRMPGGPKSRRRRGQSAGRPPTSIASVFRATPLAAGWALVAGAAGCTILLAIAIATVAGSAGPAGVTSFITGSRSGALLAARILVGLLGGIAVLALSGFGGVNGPARALALAGLVGLGGLVLTAAGSHAAAFASPIPAAVDVVHLVAASVWLAGLGLLAAVTDFGRASRLAPGALRSVVPRFSALALVSVATIALTGAYADWTLTRDPFSAGTAYQLNLVVKIAIFAVALGLGALNFLDGGEGRPWLGGLSKRLAAELVVGIAVLAIAANLTSGSPTALDRPVGIEPAASTAASGAPLSLALLPGRPGPNRVVVEGAAPGASGAAVELVLQRLDTEEGTARIAMRAEPGATEPRFVADATLPEGSRWDATLVAKDPAGTEIGRERFVFALDAEGVSEGRSVPPVDPGLLLAILLLCLGVAGLAFVLAGGVLPRTLPDASRPALLGASTASALMGLAMLVVAGPR